MVERLRQEPRSAHTPIIIVTSRDRAEDRARGIEVGADAYITKGGFDQSRLLDTIRSLIG
jgi:DNA-binding response OmpR family regulator